MPRVKKQKQIRKCAQCDKVGHNKATCTEVPPTPSSPIAPAVQPPKSTASPLKFFVHHVQTEPTTSPHVLNLKTHTSQIWKQVEPVSPSPTHAPLTKFLPPEPPTPALSSLEDLVQPEPTIESLIPTKSVTVSQDQPELFSTLPPQSEPDSKYTSHTLLDKTPDTEPDQPRSSAAHAVGNFLHRILHPKLTVLGGAALCLVLVSLVAPTWAWGYYTQLQTVKQTVLDSSTAGFMALQESTAALKQANFAAASDATDRALNNFSTALDTIQDHKVLKTLASVIPVVSGEVMSREHILLAGDELALGNKQLLDGITGVQQFASSSLIEKIDGLNAALGQALPSYTRAQQNLSKVDISTLPPQYQTSFNDFRTIFNAAIDDFGALQQIAGRFHDIFGGDGLRRYLLVFQNENELRPTGGFMGSYALLDVRGGKIVNLTIPAGGTYDVQGQLSVFEQPPTPLTLNNNRWEFQDANWYPDFPTSAEQMMWFYRKSRGTTVDGVIAINSNFLTRLLTIFGPVTDESRNITITQDNAVHTIQTLVETGSDKAQNKPKQIIADLAPQFLASFGNLQTSSVLPLLVAVQEALQEKEIQLYFTDHATQSLMNQFGWSGAITPTTENQDYLSVINTNIGGQKSDARIKQTINHQAVVQADGSVIDTVTITREHTGKSTEPLYGAVNTDYIRVYVPLGSELMSARGFSWPPEKNFHVPEARYTTDERLAANEQEIELDSDSGTRVTNEFNKTAFGNWVIVGPGETATVEFTYRLPFTIHPSNENSSAGVLWHTVSRVLEQPTAKYQLVVQKQSGITSDFSSHFIFPDSWHPLWRTDEAMHLAKNGAVIFSLPLTSDKIFGLLMQPDSRSY